MLKKHGKARTPRTPFYIIAKSQGSPFYMMEI